VKQKNYICQAIKGGVTTLPWWETNAATWPKIQSVHAKLAEL
jgi:hypothetical protein